MNLKHSILLLSTALALMSCAGTKKADTAEVATPEPSLKEAFGDKFLVGAALNVRQAAGRDSAATAVIRQHFNAVVAENCMKVEELQPVEGQFDWSKADQLVKFAEENDLTLTGHCLVWHSQLPRWFCFDEKGKLVKPEVLKQRMKTHITTVLDHFRGKCLGWDVVNEAIEDDGSYRKSPLYQILGEEFIPLAFQYAYEADSTIELYYNDYSMNKPAKRDAVVKLVQKLRDRGLRIDAIGMQSHMGMDFPDLTEYEESIEAFAATGCKVMITEWDMSALPNAHQSANIADREAYRASLNPYTTGLPDSVSDAWSQRVCDVFRILLKHSDVISRFTAWGVSDKGSWKNDFPVRGRTDYPLLFDRDYQAKPVVLDLIQEAQQ